jgi:sugar lactone lactonase YvrE
VSERFESLGTGFLFTEGPVWHPAGKFLLFSDMPGDHLHRWAASDGITTFRKPCHMSNGLTYDRQGRLLACEHASSQVTRTETDGRNVDFCLDLADQVYVLEKGRIRYQGSAREFREDESIRHQYLAL